ncbi:thioredoxin [Corynebacterium sp. CCM 9185]|uniref:Thioredoxin n=1 Tax=Corynebacterium marambiense TaxID=2765364 RepID=A0ABS0VSU7_9CORY|nr:thioredoxin [Corynebacterium marambiense]MBI8999822.1 thioredoxin [Corynebacterium marambiense]MCK7662661.1 thioredoxin [Corynebacterium marambiense]MCX7543672.1 thioredoxin [Corynebacterium marambiense]
MSTPVSVTESTFEELVLGADKPVLVDFWAEWCGPCRKLSPIIDQVAEEMGDRAVIAKVDVDAERGLGARYQIMSIPTLMFFSRGNKIAEFNRPRSRSAIVSQLEGMI